MFNIGPGVTAQHTLSIGGTESWTDSKLDMEQNVAYESSTDHDAQISLASN